MRDCGYIWRNLFINAKGEIYSCCLEKPESYGNIANFNYNRFCIKLEKARRKEECKNLPCLKNCLIIPKDFKFKNRVNQFKKINRLHIEWGYKCNAHCNFCFQRKIKNNQNLNYNDVYNFVKCFKINEFQIQGGEPLIISDCMEFINYICNKLNAKITLQTNGISFTPYIFNSLKNGVTKIIVSLNAATDKTYFKIMKVDKFNVVIDNIKNMTNNTSHNVIIETHMTVVPENLIEIIPFLKLSKKLKVNSISFCPNCETDLAIVAIRKMGNLKFNISKTLRNFTANSTFPYIDKNSQDYIYKLTDPHS